MAYLRPCSIIAFIVSSWNISSAWLSASKKRGEGGFLPETTREMYARSGPPTRIIIAAKPRVRRTETDNSFEITEQE